MFLFPRIGQKMQFKHFFAVVTFLVDAVFVYVDIGLDVALLGNYINQARAWEEYPYRFPSTDGVKGTTDIGNYTVQEWEIAVLPEVTVMPVWEMAVMPAVADNPEINGSLGRDYLATTGSKHR